ncbi:hypothetical protein TTHERM_01050570 (macronuclear) [Tetrahymena thermophila SB210]|uniref:Uncharacterized protein n=1 Tax=Tetrahymena thermophila (strain SB210) TaxID=312017 RepID=Q22XJ9_TETTS|nr:hypothetical protein TTHERM_01050570 [Tetrahymena thermophila SB210]EAR90011.2 hypothetical protein TTHERM_01050570 [Tetrahymena thermophila SB210]|eukprot:XP_001010256.2 hypothetical protein TTHERM_01050570 [Tetrahymena thermophila SB210]
MIDYFKAFEEEYIPIDVQKGIQINGEEMFLLLQETYRSQVFNKDYKRVYEGLLNEDYESLKFVTYNIKSTLGYLSPFVAYDVCEQLHLFIRVRIPAREGKIQFPFTEEDKQRVYKDSIFILTEMTALLRYFSKNYPDFQDKYSFQSAKKIIDDCYKFYFKRFSIPFNDEQNMNTNTNNNNNNNNNIINKNLEKQKGSQTEKLQKSQQVASVGNDNSLAIKESSMRQVTQDKDEQKKKSKNTQSATASPIKEKNNTVVADPEGKKEEGVGINDIKLEQQEKNQPCCNDCNIF